MRFFWNGSDPFIITFRRLSSPKEKLILFFCAGDVQRLEGLERRLGLLEERTNNVSRLCGQGQGVRGLDGFMV